VVLDVAILYGVKMAVGARCSCCVVCVRACNGGRALYLDPNMSCLC
jgi:hypothetical protein